MELGAVGNDGGPTTPSSTTGPCSSPQGHAHHLDLGETAELAVHGERAGGAPGDGGAADVHHLDAARAVSCARRFEEHGEVADEVVVLGAVNELEVIALIESDSAEGSARPQEGRGLGSCAGA